MNYAEIFEQRGHLYNGAHRIAPHARQEELAALIQWLAPRAGETIVVTAAGGGFDARGIAAAVLPETARIICVEPSPAFSAEIPRELPLLQTPHDDIPLESNSVDAVVNLAAMHHIENRMAVLREWTRLLKPGGRLVIGDVEAGRSNAEFLNRAVDAYTPGGHAGSFLVPGDLSQALRDVSSWSDLVEGREEYEWGFRSEGELVEFVQSLFGMSLATGEQVRQAVEHYLGIRRPGRRAPVAFPWSLRFVRAVKADK